MKVLIVDDHALVREMLAERLPHELAVETVLTASNAQEAVDVARAREPDIVVMDVDMPGLDAFAGAREILRERPVTKVVFLSAYTHDYYIDEALAVGARGYVTKAEPPETIVDAIREVSEDRMFYSEDIRGRLTEGDGRARTGGGAGGGGSTRLSRLTPREMDVLRYIARGFSKRDIAATLNISLKTVEKHAENLMARLEIHDRVELTRFAIRERLVEP